MRIVIIGGEAAGMSAAAKARRIATDAEIIVLEQTDVLSFGACGLPYYVADHFDDTGYMTDRTAEQFAASGIEVKTFHRVLEVQSNEKTLIVKNLVNDETFAMAYDELMIATGARVALPNITNLHLDNVFTLKTLTDGVALKQAAFNQDIKSVAVIGSGFIGLEVVEAMEKLGKQVRLIEFAERIILDAFDKEISDVLEQELRLHHVAIHLGEGVTDLIGDEQGKVTALRTNKGTYDADLVVICTGVKPNTDFLKSTGMDMLANGAIRINDQGKTSVDHIWAAGDCATVYHFVKQQDVYIPLATTANKIGRMVGENMAGLDKRFAGTLGSSAVKVIEQEAGRTGISEGDAIAMGIDYKTVVITDKSHTNYYPGQAPILAKLVYDAETKVILGGQIVGVRGAVLRVDVLAAAISKKMTTEELGSLDLCYAPPFSRTWDLLNVVGNVAK